MRARAALLLSLAAACGGLDAPLADDEAPLGSAVLPGGGAGGPLVVSNNPEIFTGDGVLFSTASSDRGGAPLPLEGHFGVYLHHLNRSGSARRLRVLVWSAGRGATVRARGSGYTQADTGGVALGHSPDARVAADWITGRARSVFGPATLAARGADAPPDAANAPSPPGSPPAALFDELVPAASEVDARFAVVASAPVFVAVVAGEELGAPAPGLVDSPGPGRLGREAGVYAHDTWTGELDVRVPAPGSPARSFRLDAPEQAFPALLALDDSAATSIGMYGVVYDLRVRLSHDGADARPRHVRLSLATSATGFGSRAWDGLWLVDGRAVQAQLTAGRPEIALDDLVLAPGETRLVSLRAMVPGLATMPESLAVTSR